MRPFYVKDSYVKGSVESVNIKIYGTFVRIDAGNSTRKRISSVGGAMNARFRDQFRTTIEVREIGNPSGNDVVRFLHSTHAVYRERSLCFFFILLSERKGRKERKNRTAGKGNGKDAGTIPRSSHRDQHFRFLA